MGIHTQLARALIAARAAGADFTRTLMLGRLRLYATPEQIGQFLEAYGLPGDASTLAGATYAEPFLQLLGAQQVDALDASDFEGASLIHDLNQPVPSDWHQRYDLVLDGGTMEHVFHFPTALQSAMQLVREGGSLFLCLPANNFSGHGFYTFSPELFYSALTEDNGYRVERMLLAEYYPDSPWYEVRSPRAAGKRVMIVSDGQQAHLMVHARRTQVVPLFQKAPQQSDYQAAWREGPAAPTVKRRWYDGVPLLGWIGARWRAVRQGAFFRRRRNLRRWSVAAQPDLFTRVDR